MVNSQAVAGFGQVYLDQTATDVLGYLRHCHTWFCSSLGYLIPNLKCARTDTEHMQQPKCEVLLDPELSSVISTEDILPSTRTSWFWSTPSQGHLVDLLLVTLKMV